MVAWLTHLLSHLLNIRSSTHTPWHADQHIYTPHSRILLQPLTFISFHFSSVLISYILLFSIVLFSLFLFPLHLLHFLSSYFSLLLISNASTDTHTQADTHTDTATETHTDTHTHTETQADTDTHTHNETQAETDTHTDTDTESTEPMTGMKQKW